ncbi:MAG TPA: copper chaperone PCu(A)C [Xanthobacteraceae bacterium]|nr:copper chaperone PCu(A)C [Xanthobacteraceae bacterium]
MSYFTRGFLRRGLIAAGALAVAQIAALGAQAADYDVGAIHISKPWARATPKGASNGAGYLTVTSAATAPDRMTCTGSDAAASCHIHSMTMDNGVMKMRPVEGGLELKPSESVTLKPGGFHVMLVDLKHPLEAGKTVEVTLQFEKAGTVKVELPVLAIGAPAPNADAGGSMGNTMQGGNMMHGGGMMQMDKH